MQLGLREFIAVLFGYIFVSEFCCCGCNRGSDSLARKKES
jgi:hypothetical protein